MKAFACFLGLFAALVQCKLDVEDGVLVLGDHNFEEATATHGQMLVEFYAPWCGHCKTLAPEWVKAAKTLSDSPLKLAKVDATEHKSLAQKYEIKGFPTIKYIKNGKASDYSGGRTANDIVNWVNKKSGPSASQITTAEELTKFQEKHDVFALGVFSSIDSDSAKAFVALSDSDESHIYAVTTAASVKSTLGLDTDTVVVMKSFDDRRADHVLTGEFSAEEVEMFVTANSIPLVQEFSPEAAKKIFGSPIQQHVLFFTDKSQDHHAPTMAAYSAAAAQFKGKLMFINVPSSESKILNYFGITAEMIPTMVLADLRSESGVKKYPYTGATEASEIAAFANAFLDGSLKPVLKSEEVSEEDTTGAVKVLKGTSFSDIVLNNNKDVLVEFYAPWCGHCKKLEPIWNELAEEMQSKNSNVVIAKMDATANEVDVPGLAVKGFPTIYFFKGTDKSHPIKYESGRELNDFVSYLETHASSSTSTEDAREEL